MSSLTLEANDRPPKPTELEMTVFGPGVGECIVLHLGCGDWMIIDSCTDPLGSEPVALSYLRRIGIDPADGVRKILATHWHDDHIVGMASLLRQCPNAEFIISAALAGSEFLRLVLEVNSQNRLVKHNSSASEFAEILEILEQRTSTPYAVGPHIYAQDGSRLFQGGHEGTTEVWALSPSAGTVTNSMVGIAEQLLTSGNSRRFRRFSPNDLSVAILIKANSFSLLLGADLENSLPDQFGWKAVLSSNLRPIARSEAFKVAHHGSVNADHDDIWTSLLVAQSIAIVTPFAKLRDPLPTSSDVKRIKSKTENAYCTTWPPSRKPPRRNGVDGIVRGATKSRRSLNQTSGYVRLRVDLSTPIAEATIERFGSATQL